LGWAYSTRRFFEFDRIDSLKELNFTQSNFRATYGTSEYSLQVADKLGKRLSRSIARSRRTRFYTGNASGIDSFHSFIRTAEAANDEELDPFDVDFDESPGTYVFRDDELRRQDSISEYEAEADAYFKKYVKASFHPDHMTADNAVRVYIR
jgi:hypothetical protein